MSEYLVSSVAQFNTALGRAHAGDTIKLAAGNYSGLSIVNRNFPSGITITSADPDHKAVVSALSVRNSSGINLSNLELSTSVNTTQVFAIRDSANITLDALDVHGPAGNVSQSQIGSLLVAGSSNVTVVNSDFHNMSAGLTLENNTDTMVTGNYFHDLRTDGIHGGGNSDITISKNVFSDFYPAPGDHPDGIQIWQLERNLPAQGINIADNMFVRGAGAPTQGIFFAYWEGPQFKDVSITGNILVGESYRAISVDQADGVKIANNTVLAYDDRASWISTERSSNVVAENNLASEFKFMGEVESSGNVYARPLIDRGAEAIDSWLSNKAGFRGAWGTGEEWVSDHGLTYTAAVAAANAKRSPYEVIAGTSGDDRLTAHRALASELRGGAGDDQLVGHETLQVRMVGGTGNDAYTVKGADNLVVEDANGGYDKVFASVDYTLTANVEDLVMRVAGTTGTGNELANVISGSTGVDRIYGMAGDDRIGAGDGDDFVWGGAGNDKLYGNAGDDMLYGEDGNDLMYGGDGNDRVDGGAGNDDLRGEAGSDLIYGRSGNDLISGGDGDDTLYGNDGNDDLRGDAGNDRIYGGPDNDKLSGGEGNDTLYGEDGNDTLFAGAGNDKLYGGAGADVFSFGATDFAAGVAQSVKMIGDFSAAQGDRIDLSAIDAKAGTAANDKFKFIGTGAFTHAAGELRYEIVDGTTKVLGDMNGDGRADMMLTLTGITALTASDFVL